jgi:preprotein translocase subunit YajC
MSGLILLPLIAVMIWLMIIPQRRQMKEQRMLLANLAEGDAVLTSAGIYGIVTELDGDVMYLEVADGIELKMSKAAVSRRMVEPADTEATAEDQ